MLGTGYQRWNILAVPGRRGASADFTRGSLLPPLLAIGPSEGEEMVGNRGKSRCTVLTIIIGCEIIGAHIYKMILSTSKAVLAVSCRTTLCSQSRGHQRGHYRPGDMYQGSLVRNPVTSVTSHMTCHQLQDRFWALICWIPSGATFSARSQSPPPSFTDRRSGPSTTALFTLQPHRHRRPYEHRIDKFVTHLAAIEDSASFWNKNSFPSPVTAPEPSRSPPGVKPRLAPGRRDSPVVNRRK